MGIQKNIPSQKQGQKSSRPLGAVLCVTLLLFTSTSSWAEQGHQSKKASLTPNIHSVFAEIQGGQETGDGRYFNRADQWLNQIPPKGKNQGKILGLRAWIAVFQHDFERAAELAEKALLLQPGVAFHYGVLSDAALELGDYEKALRSTQKMLDLKPDQAAFSRAAHLRELFGDPTGAIEFWEKAIEAGAPTPVSTAWCQVELGDVYFNQGHIKTAQQHYQRALETRPGDHRALARLARIHHLKNNHAGAEQLYQSAIATLPLPQYLADLGDFYLETGRIKKANAQFEQVALSAQLDTLTAKQPNRDLALFYANHDLNIEKAVQIAESAIKSRKDIFTYDVLAWSYFKAKRYTEAHAAITHALKLGTKNATLHYHAGRISQALGNSAAAKKHFESALAQNPYFDLKKAKIAKQHLAHLALTQKGAPS